MLLMPSTTGARRTRRYSLTSYILPPYMNMGIALWKVLDGLCFNHHQYAIEPYSKYTPDLLYTSLNSPLSVNSCSPVDDLHDPPKLHMGRCGQIPLRHAER